MSVAPGDTGLTPSGPVAGSGSAAAATAPVPRSALFGHHAAVDAVVGLISAGERLVTITGPGGIGKTRVALEVVRSRDEPVVFVPLAGAGPATALTTIAQAAAPAAPLGAAPFDTLTAVLAGGPMVLLLDTFEHLLATAPMVAEILNRCPDLRVVVTSRARLRLDGEQVVRLVGLPSGAGGPAVAMFQSRARAVGGDAGDPSTVADICAAVHGNPLAIELAAARTTVLSPAELLARLRAGQLGVLSRGGADMAPRHGSIRKTIAWSTALLEPAAEAFFRACSVFPDTFSLEAAEAVGGGDVLDALAELVDLHLVEPVDGVGARRYRMLDTIREYGRELLGAGPNTATVRDRLVDWSLDFAGQAGLGLVSAHEREWIGQVGQELPTLRVALQILAEQNDVGRGAGLVSRLGPYWTYRGPTSEGRRWLQTFISGETAGIHGETAGLRRGTAALHEEAAGLREGTAHLTDEMRALATAWACRLSIEEGDLGAVEPLERARASMSRDGHAVTDWLQVTEHLAYGLTMGGDLERADRLTAEGIATARSAGQPFWLAIFLQRRALSALRHQQNQRAIAYARESVEVARAIGYDRIVAWSEQILALLDGGPVDGDSTYRALLANLAAHRACGDGRGAVSAMAGLGAICKPEDYRTSARWYREGIEESQRLGYWHGEAFCVMGLAAAAAGAQRFRDAMDLDRALGPYMAQLKAQVPPHLFAEYQATMAQAAAQLGDVVEVPWCRPPAWPAIRERALLLAQELTSLDSQVEAEPCLAPRTRMSPLSRREVQVLARIANGHTNAQIARDLYLSPKTVMHHSTSIYRKLDVRGRAEAVAAAYRTGLSRTPAWDLGVAT